MSDNWGICRSVLDVNAVMSVCEHHDSHDLVEPQRAAFAIAVQETLSTVRPRHGGGRGFGVYYNLVTGREGAVVVREEWCSLRSEVGDIGDRWVLGSGSCSGRLKDQVYYHLGTG